MLGDQRLKLLTSSIELGPDKVEPKDQSLELRELRGGMEPRAHSSELRA